MKQEKITSGRLSAVCMELALMLNAGLGAGEGLRLLGEPFELRPGHLALSEHLLELRLRACWRG